MEKYMKNLENKDLTREEFLPIWKEFKEDLNTGKIRVAEKENGEWKVNAWVKKVILLGFKFGKKYANLRMERLIKTQWEKER